MPTRYETLLERETIIRWDATGEPATLWTAEPRVKNLWISYGFPVERKGGGWGCSVPVDRITYKPLKSAQKQAENSPVLEDSDADVAPEPSDSTEPV